MTSLSLLASVIPTASNDIKSVTIGTITGVPFELFEFPTGTYFRVDQIDSLFFRSSLMKEMSKDQIEMLVKDMVTGTIYISSNLLRLLSSLLGSKQESERVRLLSLLSIDDVLNGAAFEIDLKPISLLKTPLENSLTVHLSNIKAKRQMASDIDNEQKHKNKKLSIETRSPELNNDQIIAEKSILLKNSQQRIIDGRLSASTDLHNQNTIGNLKVAAGVDRAHVDRLSKVIPIQADKERPIIERKKVGIEASVSPRTEFPNRELPMPPGYYDGNQHLSVNNHPKSAYPGSAHKNPHQNSVHPKSAHPGHTQQIPNAMQTSPLPKSVFLQNCEAFFDSMEIQKMHLAEQVKISRALVQSLSLSTQVIESTIKSKIKEFQESYADNVGKGLADLDERLSKVEAKVNQKVKDI